MVEVASWTAAFTKCSQAMSGHQRSHAAAVRKATPARYMIEIVSACQMLWIQRPDILPFLTPSNRRVVLLLQHGPFLLSCVPLLHLDNYTSSLWKPRVDNDTRISIEVQVLYGSQRRRTSSMPSQRETLVGYRSTRLHNNNNMIFMCKQVKIYQQEVSV